MSQLCEMCPVRDTCLQFILEKACPIPKQPNENKAKKRNKK